MNTEMNRKTRRAFATLWRRKKLRLMRPLLSPQEFVLVRTFAPERF